MVIGDTRGGVNGQHGQYCLDPPKKLARGAGRDAADDSGFYTRGSPIPSDDPFEGRAAPANRHGEEGAFVFADGSVRTMSRDELDNITVENPEGNNDNWHGYGLTGREPELE